MISLIKLWCSINAPGTAAKEPAASATRAAATARVGLAHQPYSLASAPGNRRRPLPQLQLASIASPAHVTPSRPRVPSESPPDADPDADAAVHSLCGDREQARPPSNKEDLCWPCVLWLSRRIQTNCPGTFASNQLKCLRVTRSKLSRPRRLLLHAKDSTARPSLRAILSSARGKLQLIPKLQVN